MRWTAAGVLAVACAAGCGAAPERDTEPASESASLRACTAHVERRTGQVFLEAEPAWRLTSRREGDGFVVNIWTGTATAASRPVGDPDHVCVTAVDVEDGVRVLRTRP